MNILLLSAYNTPSHNYWCRLLIDNLPQFRWTHLTLPPRKFSWRIRGNPLSWYAESRDILSKGYNTVLATSMVDLATVIGLFPNLGQCKKIIYFHENQFEFPLSAMKSTNNVESMMVNLYGALCADIVLFNSNYNRDSFALGAKRLLKRINDFSPVTVVDDIISKSEILPVPICRRTAAEHIKIPRSIIWNHRWEYDKNPEDFYKALKILKGENIDFKLIMMGIQFKSSPKIFERIREEFHENILCWGEQSRKDYNNWLKKGEFIISTAIHEFQGLAVMEAVQMGAIPVVPNRLSYPQWFPKECLYKESPEDLANRLKELFEEKIQPPALDALIWESLEDDYKKTLST